MSGHKQFQRINLQIIKTYSLQRFPIISICLDHQQGNERLYFGTCEEPSNRLVAFHDLNLFVNKAFYFVHRNSQEVYQGLLPIMYYAFYRNQFTNMIFLGPTGISQFIMLTRYMLGIRNLAFGALDLNKEMIIKQQKFGIGNKIQFLEMIKNTIDKHEMQNLDGVNKIIKEKASQYVIPKDFVDQNKQISLEYSKVKAFFGNNPNLTQYLVTFKVEQQLDFEKCRQLNVPLSKLPEVKEGKVIVNNKILTFEEIQKFNPQLLQQGILILDFKHEDEVEDFVSNIFDQLKNELQLYQKEFKSYQQNKNLNQTLIIVHYANKHLLESKIYNKLINKLKNLNYKIVHIITSQEYYQELDKISQKDMGREKFGYYYLDYLKIMRQCLPNLFRGQDQINQFQINNKMTNLNSLWTNEIKYLPMRMKTIQIQNGILQFEDLKVKRQISYSLQREEKQILIRLNNEIVNTQNKSYEVLMLGTSSSIENQSRNASGIHVKIKNVGILMDCGQNTLNQFYFSCQNDEEFKQKINNVQIIYISHSHNDHHQGLYDFIKHKCQLSKEPFFLLLPKPIYLWYSQLFTNLFKEEFGLKSYVHQIKIVFTDALINSNLIEQIQSQSHQTFKINNLESEEFPEINFQLNFDNNLNKMEFQEFLNYNNLQLDIAMTQHCQFSTGIKLTSNGKTIVYSSDRLGKLKKFRNKFFEFAQNCDLLIHECTYPDEMMEKAIAVKHSTFVQAFFNAYEMKAKNLVVTHFTERSLFYLKGFFNTEGNLNIPQFKKLLQKYSQESTKPFDIDDAVKYLENNVIFASDFLIFGDGNIEKLSKISRIIAKSLFP
ncbi:unnamed protein product [Paramecium primaurelia]|uniref:Metallo-beta-lactamase domain-containing protein n=1 Tax=Paramecium primaurelia TaxID=5886 RepID=A0A8S1KJK2_PARPR|nr:unnamed protein product [Paramecium primaurelia]